MITIMKNVRHFSLFLYTLLFFLVGIQTPTHADVQVAQKSILDMKTESTLEDLPESPLHLSGTPATDKDVILILRTGGAFVDIRGFVRQDSKRLAETIEKVIGGTVYYQEGRHYAIQSSPNTTTTETA
jgi:hypothetical protein